ncbi:Glycosyltransferase family 1 protein [Coniochaeta hoffmannii]|uniref:Glycosyltransferase family 1 protein n=1 Tax=Coniochaeta hoffmannii TaxID=91930 RepID=A0AA38RZ52_9PEZI|nr:Glycosyltransferase family 1 protein [Coniochaeta hoffmannii]
MTTQAPSELGRPDPETVLQQSILQQAEAVVAAQTNPARPMRQEALLQEMDLMDAAGDEVPPPAYGDTYGEIRNDKAGLDTTASVADDGRVNIRINQFNRRLSQIFIPALRQQIQSAQDSRPPPPPYIPPSLGGEEGVPPPPSLNVVIQVVGSRGDVQPFVALGKVLKDTYGHRVRLATHPNFQHFVQEHGLEFFSIGGDPSRLMAYMVKNPGLVPGFRSLLSGEVRQRRRDVAEYIQGCWRSCYQAGDGMGLPDTDDELSQPAARPFVADCIIANPPSFAHIHCAEKLGIPLHIMFTMPYSPTQAFPHPLANIQSSNADPQVTNYMSYAMIELLSWQALGDIINRFRAKCLGLDPVSLIWGPGMLQRLKVPHTYCWSPALIPKPKDWGPNISISGFFSLNLASNYTAATDLQAFLDVGSPPVYIGFGSIVLEDPDAMTELIFEAVKRTGQRVLLSKGWGGMGADELHIPEGVFMLGNVPHDWLFKHVSCVVHHGGAGTTAAGLAAGRPTLVVPFFGDQPFWGAVVARAGAGPDPIPHKQLTAGKLADAITFCLRPESLDRAKELASKIAAEQGSDVGAQSFHQYLELWGDDTVRPQAQVSDFMSGAKAAGKEFGLGWYDGVTGLVTQPWRGAQKEGASGFFKGIGKGMGGLVAKPGAAIWGVPGYVMKGVHKEVQKLFGSNVQNYIIASRTAQGYEEWLQSSDAEKQDVIVRWKLIQKYLKKKRSPDEMVRDILEAQRKMNMEDSGRTASSAQSANSVDISTQDAESVMLALGGSQSLLRPANATPEDPLRAAETSETIRTPVQETSRGDAEEDANVEWSIQEGVYRLRRQRQEAADHQIEQETLRQAMATSEAEAQRHARAALEYEEQLKRVIAQSLGEQIQTASHGEWHSDLGLDDEDVKELEQARGRPEERAVKATAVAARPPSVQHSPSHDPGHLAGTTQSEFDAQQHGHEEDKTTQEKTEEEIVMEYVKRQSRLEQHHQNKGKGRPTAAEDMDDVDLQKALKLSMQGHQHAAEYWHGEASGT